MTESMQVGGKTAYRHRLLLLLDEFPTLGRLEFFETALAFIANGGDGTITMVGETSPGKFEPVATIQTLRGARTIGADSKAHKLYLPDAEFGPATEGKDGKKGRPQAIPDSFVIIVVGR